MLPEGAASFEPFILNIEMIKTQEQGNAAQVPDALVSAAAQGTDEV